MRGKEKLRPLFRTGKHIGHRLADAIFPQAHLTLVQCTQKWQEEGGWSVLLVPQALIPLNG